MIVHAVHPVPRLSRARTGLPVVGWDKAVTPVEIPEIDRREFLTVATVRGPEEWDYVGHCRPGRLREVRLRGGALWMALVSEDRDDPGGAMPAVRLAELLGSGRIGGLCGRNAGDHFVGTPFLADAPMGEGRPDPDMEALAAQAAASHAAARIASVEGEALVRLPGAMVVANAGWRAPFRLEIPRDAYAGEWAVACPVHGEALHALALASLKDDGASGRLYEADHERRHGAAFPWSLSDGADLAHFANVAHGRAVALAGNATRTALRGHGDGRLREAATRSVRWSALGAVGLVGEADVRPAVEDLVEYLEAALAAAPHLARNRELGFMLGYARAFALPRLAPPVLEADAEALGGLAP